MDKLTPTDQDGPTDTLVINAGCNPETVIISDPISDAPDRVIDAKQLRDGASVEIGGQRYVLKGASK
jgi:hypothetical protein